MRLPRLADLHLRLRRDRTELVLACQGDALQCGRVYDRHGGALLRFAHWVGGQRDMGNDVIHDIFVMMLEGRLAYDAGKGDARSFLLTVTRYRLMSALRDSLRLDPLDEEDEPPDPSTAHDPMEALVRARDAAFVAAVLRDLPYPQREVLVLKEFEGYSYDEIAALAQVPIGTVRSRLNRARAAFLAAYTGQMER